jgi:hypothetical protein
MTAGRGAQSLMYATLKKFGHTPKFPILTDDSSQDDIGRGLLTGESSALTVASYHMKAGSVLPGGRRKITQNRPYKNKFGGGKLKAINRP